MLVEGANILGARDKLFALNASSYSNLKESGRTKLWKRIERLAFPTTQNNVQSTSEVANSLARMLQNGR